VEDVDELVVLAQLDRDDSVRPERRVVVRKRALLDDPVLGRQRQVLGLPEVARLDRCADLLLLREGQEIHDRASLRLARAQRQLVHLQAVDLADGREKQDVVVRGGDDQVLDVVVLLEVHAHHADPAAPLLAVRGHG
jgi:hypothetical protein